MNHEQLAIDELARCREIARAQFSVAPYVTHAWDVRGLKAGQARSRIGADTHLRFNRNIAIAEGDAYRKTVAHEYAHAVVFAARPAVFSSRWAKHQWSAHGPQWQHVMRAFGYEPDRCHRYKSATRAVERRDYLYRCTCNEHRLSIVRHRKAQAGTAKYRCNRCRTRIAYVGPAVDYAGMGALA